MQCGPRGSFVTGQDRNMVTPAARSTAATLSPAAAEIICLVEVDADARLNDI
jgi:hypothetical protein